MAFPGIASAVTGLVTGVGNAVGGVAKIFVGDRSAREAGYHDENMESRRQFSTEFQVARRTWFDSLVDGINRMPRPAFVGLVIYYLVLSYVDPIEFQKVNIALDSVPDRIWDIIEYIILPFYFIARELQKGRDKKMALTKAEFDERMRQTRELEAMKNPPASPAPAVYAPDGLSPAERETANRADPAREKPFVDDTEFKREMASDDPLSLPSILEWNRRRQQGNQQ